MLLRAAESHTTPGERKSKAGAKLGWCPMRLIKPPTSNIKPLFFLTMSFEDYDSKALERIADSLEKAFSTREEPIYQPVTRIAHALESIAKSMDDSFQATWDE